MAPRGLVVLFGIVFSLASLEACNAGRNTSASYTPDEADERLLESTVLELRDMWLQLHNGTLPRDFLENAKSVAKEFNRLPVSSDRRMLAHKKGVYTGPPLPATLFSDKDIYALYTTTNAARSGKYKRHSLYWNPFLADYAQAWANKVGAAACAAKPVNGVYGRQVVYRPKNIYGENLFYEYWKGATKDPYPASSIIKFWALEGRYYNYRANTCAKGQYCGDYIQLLWKPTKTFGCGVKICNLKYAPTYKFKTVVCDYAPIGYTGGRPY